MKRFNLLLMAAISIFATACQQVIQQEVKSPDVAVIISVTFVLVFCEIIPQALFSSDPILAGSKLAWLVRSFQIILFPIARPIAWLLDRCIPARHAVYYTHKEISALVEMADDFSHPDQKIFIRMLAFCNYTINVNICDRVDPDV